MNEIVREALARDITWWPVVLTLIVFPLVREAGRWWRERSALRLAPRVYESGGDPADVLRALRGTPADHSD